MFFMRLHTPLYSRRITDAVYLVVMHRFYFGQSHRSLIAVIRRFLENLQTCTLYIPHSPHYLICCIFAKSG